MAGNFNLADYETVDSRIHKFYEAHKFGRIITELIEARTNDVGQIVQYIVKAEIWRDLGDTVPSATGYAEEILGSNPVNRTSALENCETSAIGRALANLGFSTKGARPSQEEMTKAERTKAPAKVKEPIAPKPSTDKLQVEAYDKCKWYKIPSANVDEFLIEFAGVKTWADINWYVLSLEPKKAWDDAVKKFNDKQK